MDIMINSTPNRSYDSCSAKTSAFDFLLAMQAFLGRNHIDFIGPFRMRLETAYDNNWTLLVEGETSGPDSDVPNESTLGLLWPSLPSPPDELPEQEMEVAAVDTNIFSSGRQMSVHTPVDRDTGSNYSGNPESVKLHYSSMSSEQPGLFFVDTEALLDSIDSIPINTQAPSANMLTVDHEYNSPQAARDNVFPSHTLETDNRFNATSPGATGPTVDRTKSSNAPFPCYKNKEARTRHKGALRRYKSHKQKIRLDSSDNESELVIKYLSQNMICQDFYGFLDSELPRWIRQGLWHETSQTLTQLDPTLAPSPYVKLERAYRVVCHVNSRMSDDLVRDRVGLIRLHLEYLETRHASGSSRTASTVGRGDASQVIDHILENIHEEWVTLDQKRRAGLRAKFHERKKYGKRWFQLANALGPGILLICSTRLANAV
ncbi:hypothetical protein BDV59DRAFT_200893 [Aspergillus ambiguus]|uniref:uncharacterized protein n=1 Tax=Aspergillus ambiguus TaxID=176160 RepID=UPI003CCD22BB